jgi:hypothetical protein
MLRLEDNKTGTVCHLDPLELEGLVRAPEALRRTLVDPFWAWNDHEEDLGRQTR